MPVESVRNGSYVVRHWQLPSVRQLRTAADVDALPDDPVALKMLLVEAVIRGNGAQPLLVYGDRWLRSAADVHVLPDDPVLLKMLLAEAVIRENGAEALLVYGDKLLQNAADVHALPDDPALLKMLLMEAVYRGGRMTNYGLGHLEPGRHYVGDGTGRSCMCPGKGGCPSVNGCVLPEAASVCERSLLLSRVRFRPRGLSLPQTCASQRYKPNSKSDGASTAENVAGAHGGEPTARRPSRSSSRSSARPG